MVRGRIGFKSLINAGAREIGDVGCMSPREAAGGTGVPSGASPKPFSRKVCQVARNAVRGRR